MGQVADASAYDFNGCQDVDVTRRDVKSFYATVYYPQGSGGCGTADDFVVENVIEANGMLKLILNQIKSDSCKMYLPTMGGYEIEFPWDFAPELVGKEFKLCVFWKN